MAQTKSIFEFSDYREYLKFAQDHHPQRKRRRLSLEEWSARLGYKSPRTVGMILNGIRLPNETQVKSLVKDLAFNAREAEYFRLLVERARRFAQAKSAIDIDIKIQNLLKNVKDVLNFDEQFSYIANWYFLPLRKWIETSDFQFDPSEIRRRFRDKVSVQEIDRAFEVMAKLGLVEYVPGKSVKSKTNARIKATLGQQPHAILLHHTQMMQRAMEAMTDLPKMEREYNSWTFRMNPSHMEKLKTAIREWGEQVTNDLPDDKAEVYQLCVQAYPHTRQPEEIESL